ncbi:hypothetical protein GYMLUDRAFT_93627 [Collybiopsis luxurians FD-317 M1]|nr:hypothetical protein GYMLUDRAFT_93627 [Collybiopsis luxurians FD-317 M1]
MMPHSFSKANRRENSLSNLLLPVTHSILGVNSSSSHARETSLMGQIDQSSSRTRTEKYSSSAGPGLFTSALRSRSSVNSAASFYVEDLHAFEAPSEHLVAGYQGSQRPNVPQDILPDFTVLRRSYMQKLAQALNDSRTEPASALDSDSTGSPNWDEFLSSPFSNPYDTFEGPSVDGFNFNAAIMDAVDLSDGQDELAISDFSAADTTASDTDIVKDSNPPTLFPCQDESGLGSENPVSGLGRPDSSRHLLYSQQSSQTSARMASTPANGSRRTLTPDTLPAPDASTRPRQHSVSVSPVVESKKRSHHLSLDSDEEGDYDGAESPSKKAKEGSATEGTLPAHPGPFASEPEKLAYKRRLSTLAARRSRRRKLEYKLMLEARVEELEREREKWKTRCTVLQEILKVHDADFKFEDSESV